LYTSFDTDDWKDYSQVWPTEWQVRGKKYTFAWSKITPIPDTTLEEWPAEAK